MDDMSPNPDMMRPAAKDTGEPLAEITLCVYPGGKLALRMDDGKKVPVPDLDTAVAAIRRVVEQEGGGPLERAEKPGMNGEQEPAQEQAAETENAFVGGFKGPSGY